MKSLFLFLLLSPVMGINNVVAQRTASGHIILDLNQQVYTRGDTIWCKAYKVQTNGNSRSENMYFELLNDQGRLFSKAMFPMVNGESIGQLVITDSIPTGQYELRAYTSGQALEEDSLLTMSPIWIGKPAGRIRPSTTSSGSSESSSSPSSLSSNIQWQLDTVSNDPFAWNDWKMISSDKIKSWHVSVSVTQEDSSGEPIAPQWPDPAIKNISSSASGPESSDTSYIDITATLFQGSKILANKSFWLRVVKENTVILQKLMTTDNQGRFHIDRLFFFGDALLQFKTQDENITETQLRVRMDTVLEPVFRKPWDGTEKEMKRISVKVDQPGVQKYDTVKYKELSSVTVTAEKNNRKLMDKKYATGRFAEPAAFSYDIRNERRYKDLITFLRSHIPGLQGGMGFSRNDEPNVHGNNAGILYYVDEQLKTWDELGGYVFQDMAYIKVFKSNAIGDEVSTQFKTGGVGGMEQSLPPVLVSIYMRKGNDLQLLAEQWPGVSIHGYSSLLRFSNTRKDRITLYWEPLIDEPTFHIRFQNNATAKKFRVTVAGIANGSERFWYSKVIPQTVN